MTITRKTTRKTSSTDLTPEEIAFYSRRAAEREDTKSAAASTQAELDRWIARSEARRRQEKAAPKRKAAKPRWVNFSEVGVDKDNFADFMVALKNFGTAKGPVAAIRWLTKLNPEVTRHLELEYTGIGDGYSRKMAAATVLAEYDHQPLPFACTKCKEPMWYRATSTTHHCVNGHQAVGHKAGYIEDLLESGEAA